MHKKHNQKKIAGSCEMGKLYRFAEPIILLSIARLGDAYGYLIAREAEKMSVTNASLDTAVIYRTLHRLETTEKITSVWDNENTGPARRIYHLTDDGWQHLSEWGDFLEGMVNSLQNLTDACRVTAKWKGIHQGLDYI